MDTSIVAFQLFAFDQGFQVGHDRHLLPWNLDAYGPENIGELADTLAPGDLRKWGLGRADFPDRGAGRSPRERPIRR